MTGKLKEGDKVNEGKLCETMGISKTPMREALRVLSVEGLIRLVPNRGAFVTKPEFEEIAEMFDVMSLLEGFCAHRACEKMTSRNFAHLEKLHAKLEENFERHDQEEYIRVNNQYHSFSTRNCRQPHTQSDCRRASQKNIAVSVPVSESSGSIRVLDSRAPRFVGSVSTTRRFQGRSPDATAPAKPNPGPEKFGRAITSSDLKIKHGSEWPAAAVFKTNQQPSTKRGVPCRRKETLCGRFLLCSLRC